MSMQSINVRARNGSLYKDPVLVFKEGFLCFDDDDPPELVLWRPAANEQPWGATGLRDTIKRAMARLGGCFMVSNDQILNAMSSQRVVPGTEPFEFRPAIAVFVKLITRIPIPPIHDGSCRYPRQCTGIVLDRSMSRMDHSNLHIKVDAELDIAQFADPE